jgi:hypothetical protein
LWNDDGFFFRPIWLVVLGAGASFAHRGDSLSAGCWRLIAATVLEVPSPRHDSMGCIRATSQEQTQS